MPGGPDVYIVNHTLKKKCGKSQESKTIEMDIEDFVKRHFNEIKGIFGIDQDIIETILFTKDKNLLWKVLEAFDDDTIRKIIAEDSAEE